MQEFERKFKIDKKIEEKGKIPEKEEGVQKIPEGEKKEPFVPEKAKKEKTWKEFIEEEVKETIKNWLEKTTLSDEAKAKLLEKSLEIYEKIKRPKGYTREERAKTALNLSCDAYFCAIPRKIPKAKAKNLVEARKITKIESVEAIQRVEAMCKLIKRSPEVAKKAKEILEAYKENYPADYGKGSPSTTAASAIFIATQLGGEPISPKELNEFLGITPPTLRKKIEDIGKLGTEIFL